MNPTKSSLQWVVLAILVIVAALSRLIPHYPNVTAVGAAALFGGAYYAKRWMGFLIPILALWVSDLVLNNVVYGAYYDHFVLFTPGFEWLYGSFALIVLIGAIGLKKINIKSLVGTSIIASMIFFLVSNFGVWLVSLDFTFSWAGLMACYVKGLPFFWNTLAGNLFYVTLIFGAYSFLTERYPQLAFNYAK